MFFINFILYLSYENLIPEAISLVTLNLKELIPVDILHILFYLLFLRNSGTTQKRTIGCVIFPFCTTMD